MKPARTEDVTQAILDRLRTERRLAENNGLPVLANSFKHAIEEVERLVGHNAALVEILRDKPCPYDARYTIGECQQCGCSEGLFVGKRHSR